MMMMNVYTGAQVVSTRCSQTYHQETGIMTFLGLPLYHLHKEPSVVIQVAMCRNSMYAMQPAAFMLVKLWLNFEALEL